MPYLDKASLERSNGVFSSRHWPVYAVKVAGINIVSPRMNIGEDGVKSVGSLNPKP